MSIKEADKKSNSKKAKNVAESIVSYLRTARSRALTVLDKNTITDLYIVALIILIGVSGFGLGRLSVSEVKKSSIKIEYPQGNQRAAVGNIPPESTIIDIDREEPAEVGLLVASKKGSKYHFPWCSGAQRMKEENKIWFDSSKEAQDAGYTPAANCKGLK